MTNATLSNSIATLSIAQLKSLATTMDGIQIEGDRRLKATWVAAVTSYQSVQEQITESVEGVAVEVEPVAVEIEYIAVSIGSLLTSDTAIGIYRGILRWSLMAAYMAVLVVVTVGAWAWDAIDGEPAIVFWVKKAASSSWGQERKAQVLECFEFVGDVAAIATVTAMEGAGLIFGGCDS